LIVATRIENSTHLYHQINPLKVAKTLAFDTNRHLKHLVDNSLLIINPIEVEAPALSAGLITESGTKYRHWHCRSFQKWLQS